MANGLPVTHRFDDLELLHPAAKGRFRDLAEKLTAAFHAGRIRSLFLPFETLRTPQRQDWLLKVSIATKVGAWGSTHQYGLATDFVAYADGKWSWSQDEDWDMLDAIAAQCGLVRPVKWDRPHIEHPKAGYLLQELRSFHVKPPALKPETVALAGFQDEH